MSVLLNARSIPVSVVVPVKNEEKNLGACLSRLGAFGEIIVVDSGSTDASLEIAQQHGAKIIDFRWDGAYPKKRNWLLLNHPPVHEWVLFLDADEFVDEVFCEAVSRAVMSSAFNGYWLNYSNFFLGRRLRYGLPQKKLALFRVGFGLYERIDESGWCDLDMEIHEHPIVEGRVGEIGSPVEHNDDRGILKFIDRHREYACWEASRYALLHNGGPDGWRTLTTRQVFKYRHLNKFWYPFFYFVFCYLFRGGVLDGASGLNYAFYKAWYFQTIRLLIGQQVSSKSNGGFQRSRNPDAST